MLEVRPSEGGPAHRDHLTSQQRKTGLSTRLHVRREGVSGAGIVRSRGSGFTFSQFDRSAYGDTMPSMKRLPRFPQPLLECRDADGAPIRPVSLLLL